MLDGRGAEEVAERYCWRANQGKRDRRHRNDVPILEKEQLVAAETKERLDRAERSRTAEVGVALKWRGVAAGENRVSIEPIALQPERRNGDLAVDRHLNEMRVCQRRRHGNFDAH